jgi:hypothetical protein
MPVQSTNAAERCNESSFPDLFVIEAERAAFLQDGNVLIVEGIDTGVVTVDG